MSLVVVRVKLIRPLLMLVVSFGARVALG